MNIEERFDLHHRANPRVAGAFVPTFEQPAIHLLTLVLTGDKCFAELRLRVLQQVAHQPQIQGVNLGDIPLIRQVVRARPVVLIQLAKALVGQFVDRRFVIGQVRANESVKRALIGIGQ